MEMDRARNVPNDVVEELCALAMWAPNHKRTWPWRFAHLTGDARARYGNTIADALIASGKPAEEAEPVRTKFLRAPSILVVGAVAGESAQRTGENRDAVAAGIQNMLLAATERGLATFWGSCPPPAQLEVAKFCGFEAATFIVGHIYVGWSNGVPEAPARPPVRVNHLS